MQFYRYTFSELFWKGGVQSNSAIDKNDQMQTFLNIQTLLDRNTSEPQTELITLLLNKELVVKDVFIDADLQTLSQKVKKLLESKE